MYLGNQLSEKNILKALKKYKVKYYKSRFIEKEIANFLAKGKIVAHFNGEMEFGPRALGNRSILCSADDPSINKSLNKKLKRTEFMPFAPVTTEKLASMCFEDWNKFDLCAPFMTRTFKCKKNFISENPAVVHVDGTARPQVINKSFNKIYYQVVEHYCKTTGNKSLINTS